MAIVQPPPMPKAKQRNTVLRLYDGPVYRDWAFWLTAANVLLGAFSTATSDQPSTMPVWLDSLLGVVVIGGLFGVLPAWLRLLFRRWRWRRKMHPTEAARRKTPNHPNWSPPAPIVSPPPTLHQPPVQRPAPPPAVSLPVRPPPMAITPRPIKKPLRDIGTGVLAVARDSLPHPVARAVRALQQFHDPRDQYEAILVAAETLAITVSVTAAAMLNGRQQVGPGQVQPGRQELSALRKVYLTRGVMFGTWTSWLASLTPLLAAQPDLIPGLSEAIAGRPDTPGIVHHLNALRDERNKAAHGNKPSSRQEFALRVAALIPHLEAALSQTRFLEGIPWLLTVSSSFQPRSHAFQVVARRAMGDHPDFETRTFSWATPVADDMFYVLGPAGPVSLSPFVASRFCTHCSQLEVCYAYKTDKQHGPATFKSFDSGHDIPADELGDDLRSLPSHNQS